MSTPNELAIVQQLAAQYPQYLRPWDRAGNAYFVRLVAVTLNPSGDPNGWGLLSKPPGQNNVNGYSVDAIIYGETQQVVDIIVDFAGPNPKVSWQPTGKRNDNHWSPPTLDGAPSPRPGPDQDQPDDGGHDIPSSGPGVPGAMPSIPAGLRPAAYEVAKIVYSRMEGLTEIPSGRDDGSTLEAYQVEGTKVASAGIAAVAVDFAIGLSQKYANAPNGTSAPDGNDQADLDNRMNSVFTE